MIRVGQDCIYTPYMIVYLAIFLPKITYIQRMYIVLASPIHDQAFEILHANLDDPSL
jgi:hypothetical protein